MDRYLWLVVFVGFQFAGLVMSMREVKAISAVLSVTLAISVTEVTFAHFHYSTHLSQKLYSITFA